MAGRLQINVTLFATFFILGSVFENLPCTISFSLTTVE